MTDSGYRPLISIITVVYNGETYIEETVRSVLRQSYKNLEFIVVDGGSSDNTLNILAAYRNSIHKFVSEKDRGIYDAMNKGLALATGEWVNFLNGGDTFFSEQSISQLFASDTSGLNFIYGDSVIVGENNYQKLIKPPQLSAGSLRKSLGICHQAVFVRRSKAIPYDLNFRYKAEYVWVMDIVFSIPPSSVRYVPTPVVNYALGGFSEKGMLSNLKEFIRITRSRFGLLQVLRNMPTYLKTFLRYYKYKYIGYGR